MRRFSVLVSVVIFVALVALGLVTTQSAAQRHARRRAGRCRGVTFQARGSGTSDAALITNSGSAGSPSRQARRSTIIITLVRSCSPLSPVLSGMLRWRGGHRRPCGHERDPGPRPLMPGVEAIINLGDALFEQSVVHSARNASDGETIVWLAS